MCSVERSYLLLLTREEFPFATSKFLSFYGHEFAAAAAAAAVNMVQKASSPFVLAFSVVERRTQGSTIYGGSDVLNTFYRFLQYY
jgi:hypothetical protein